MADYAKTTWVAHTTPVSAALLNHAETQYETAKSEYQSGNWGATKLTVADYFFYRSGSTYYSLNCHTGVIDYSGTTCHSVLQSTINGLISNYGWGAIYFRSSDTFVFTSGVSHTFSGGAGCYLFSNGAKFDLQGLNSTLIDFGSDTEWLTVSNGKAHPTGISGINFFGSNSNTSCKIAIFRNMSRVCKCEKISASYVANGFELRGGMYNAVFRDVVLTYCVGTGWKLYGLDASNYGSPDEVILDHCMVANGTGGAYDTSIGLDTDGGASYHADCWWMVNCWFENNNQAVIASGSGGKIISCRLVPDQGTTPKAIVITAGAESNGLEDLTIANCEIMASPSTGYGIYNTVASRPIRIDNNIFLGEGTAIYSTTAGSQYQITDNRFKAASNTFICFSSPLCNSIIDGNYIYNNSATAVDPFVFTGSSYDNVISNNNIYMHVNCANVFSTTSTLTYTVFSGNLFEYATDAIDMNGMSNCIVIGNNFDGVTNPVTNPGSNYIRDNRGYVRNKSGTANFTASTTLVITHGLNGTPTSVTVTGSDTNSSSLWITSIGATQFTINRGNSTGTPAVYWYAEV